MRIKEGSQETLCFPPIRPHFPLSLFPFQHHIDYIVFHLDSILCYIMTQNTYNPLPTIQGLTMLCYFTKRLFNKTFSNRQEKRIKNHSPHLDMRDIHHFTYSFHYLTTYEHILEEKRA